MSLAGPCLLQPEPQRSKNLCSNFAPRHSHIDVRTSNFGIRTSTYGL